MDISVTSPLNPCKMTCCPVDNDLSTLLRTLKLDNAGTQEGKNPCHEGNGEQECHSTSAASMNIDCEPTSHRWGCAYLQAIQSQLEDVRTTNGEYLEIIFTHRELFGALPSAHRHCAEAFRGLAQLVGERTWRSDRDEDFEASSAFQHEAKAIDAYL